MFQELIVSLYETLWYNAIQKEEMMTTTTDTAVLASEDRDVEYAEAVVSWNIRMLLTAHGLSQTALGDALGINRSSMSKKLSGGTAWSLADIVKASRFLHSSPNELMDDSLMRNIGVNAELTKNPQRHAVGNDDKLLRLGLNQRPSD